MPRLALFTLLALTACATRAERIRFADAMPPEPEPAVKAVPVLPTKKLVPHHKKEAETSMELRGALAAFSARAQHFRAVASPGQVMPVEEEENWRRLLSSLDTFLARSAWDTSSFDVVRARVTADAELEQDARTYGDFPTEIAEQAVDRSTRLAVRMVELRKLHVRTREPAGTELAWPVEPVAVTSLFGKRIHPITKKYSAHWGIDLAAESGQLVSAAGRGTVIRAQWSGGCGLAVEIQHAGGVTTRYCHLSQLLVEQGLTVDKGDPVGLAGSTGSSTGAHVHFEMLRYGKPVDPLEELGTPQNAPMASASL